MFIQSTGILIVHSHEQLQKSIILGVLLESSVTTCIGKIESKWKIIFNLISKLVISIVLWLSCRRGDDHR